MSDLTREQVDAYLAEQAALEQAEDKRVYDELVALAAKYGSEIVAVVQSLPDGSAAIPGWGVRKKR